MSELFTSGSVGGAAGNCCSYPASWLMASNRAANATPNRVPV